MNTVPHDAVALRETMVDELRTLDEIRSESVTAAARAAPRHLFVPEAPLELAYAANTAVWPKHNEH